MRDSMVGWFLDHYVYIDWEFNSVGIGYSVESIIMEVWQSPVYCVSLEN